MGGMKAAETTSTVRAVSNSVSTDGGNPELALVSVKSADEGGLVADQATVGSDGMDLVGDRVVYNTLGWVKAALIMIAETISLGILSLPAVLAAIGLVPGILFIVVFGLMSTYTGFVVYQFKVKHPGMTSIAHGMELAFGRSGRWVAEITQDLMLVFIMAAHIVIFSVAFNSLTEHAICTTAFMAMGAFVSFLVSLPRTMKGNSYFSMFSCASIATATMVAMIGICISRPGYGQTHAITPSALTSFTKAAVAVSSIILAYNGHIAYPTIISEMRSPRDFPKALILLETITISFYILVAVVIYAFAGQHVAAPALGSASPLVRKIAYAFAVPTIIVAGVILALVAAKQFYKYLWEDWKKLPRVMQEKSARATWSWRGILAIVWVLAWVIACVIPFFGLLLGLIGAMFGTWFALGFPAMLWLGMNWVGSVGESYGRTWRKMGLAGLNVFIVVVCAAICVLGTYGSIEGIAANSSAGGRKPFSCASNI
ncbi:hypothetical protein LTR91_008108 [Friedmanniomyces endolithicus]|uniref:Amino acid transporter transmembrane domain-containing protein n=1 Tax=Friedmanniomyces endolithicus TaxID=329885 RepID=A0AAN6KMY8_9PEZI|nr:hypothetical protein LTR94_007320 [Friedmanniomyces endolithicus]KAK0793846.1 hypothetical protein LTR59_007988 [Friedmanniomyces endolithicus]KAK0807618.1 hypothetical protein LTR38_004839 [Friedmanniomyces endolithicus]KAK0816966.1 hypothetical protein LTR75_003320 [Friedmanniomyces endolithicus]KAK0858584.1 hypothetical protein LTR03_000009 [Friedmanniomyces endolithicus]